jgi:hypothetical protein
MLVYIHMATGATKLTGEVLSRDCSGSARYVLSLVAMPTALSAGLQWKARPFGHGKQSVHCSLSPPISDYQGLSKKAVSTVSSTSSKVLCSCFLGKLYFFLTHILCKNASGQSTVKYTTVNTTLDEMAPNTIANPYHAFNSHFLDSGCTHPASSTAAAT